MQSPIINFYNGRSIFITGGTGFMGKVLIEKLLRTCTGIKHIYVLMRAKRAHQPADRLNELVKSRLFDIVRNKQPNFIDKLVIVEGDVTLPQMGLSPGDIATLCREVSVVFHSAATVRFDDPLKQSIAINVIGTKNVIELCRRMRSVAAIVHVSTAYANCDKPIIEERFYPTDESPQQLMQLTEWMSESMLQALKPELLRARPNTYTYTKAMAEAYLINEAYDLPVIICRPSIVVASWREPVRGWIDNFNGPTGVLLAVGKGLVRSMYCNKSCTADIIPVDVVINLMITLAWHVARTRPTYFAQQLSLHEVSVKSENQQLLSEEVMITTKLLMNNKSLLYNSDNNNNNNSEDDKQYLSVSNNNSNNNNNNNNNDEEEENNNNNEYIEEDNVAFHKATCITQDDGYDSSPVTSSPELNATDEDECDDNASDNSSNISTADDASVSTNDFGQTPCYATSIDEHTDTSTNNIRKYEHQKLSSAAGANNIEVFHCTSGSINPITWGQVQTFVVALLRIYPSIQVFRYPNGNFEASKRLDTFYRKTLHYLPAYIFDFVSRMCGRRPILVKVFEKFDKAADVLSPFTTNDWLFRNSKTTTLRNQMTPEDRECFNFDISKLHWQTFFADYVLGVRHYLLKEDQRTLTQARRNLSIVYYRNLALQILLTVSCAALVVTPIMSFF